VKKTGNEAIGFSMDKDFIITFSKQKFSPLQAKAEEIDIIDIAHALSLLCRANGHIRHFYSVAQHSLNCAMEAKARGLSEEIQLACLLHDASEAYISDITRPIKRSLPQYLEFEEVQTRRPIHLIKSPGFHIFPLNVLSVLHFHCSRRRNPRRTAPFA
jgi:hypothetical protein